MAAGQQQPPGSRALENLWWPVRLAVTLTTWWIPFTIRRRLLAIGGQESTGNVNSGNGMAGNRRDLQKPPAARPRASITMGETVPTPISNSHYRRDMNMSIDDTVGALRDESAEQLTSLDSLADSRFSSHPELASAVGQ